MSKHQKYTPKHRVVREPRLLNAKRFAVSGARRSVVFSSVAVAATGAVVGAGVLQGTDKVQITAAASDIASTLPEIALAAEPADADVPERSQQVSRSDRRTDSDALKAAQLESTTTEANVVTRTEDASDADPRDIARLLLPEYGFSDSQFTCLDKLYISESNWRVDADNPTSSAYGIPQALPGKKMASEGADWATNPVTQIRWGLRYIQDRYGTPCAAWSFKQGHNWY
ncbi:lytic transglycosylase domain-containing protein [Nocardioides sp. AE5]|uniref:aggregation-promoting factor C-terminal-like domain-containing protein n=1 Tax=Nocardioides sp. AE5 TaxID=2962573 RepID=UPI002882A0A6|nr:lytic transglycosylase domain-containing protein [Nocardioides sp. AE5]MDT0202238.1 lytic transglycosylase domain-containing protein [Nocardioides sp. AE5]